MTDVNDDTATGGESGTESNAPAGAAATAPAGSPDELATLKSRNSGLNKANGELQKALDAEKGAREAAEKAADDLRTGKTSEQEALAKLLADAKAEVAATKADAALARIEAKYPETHKLFGAATASMSADVLAASEARLTGAPDAGEKETDKPPKPVGNNPQRGAGAKNIEDMTSKELQDYMKSLDPSVMGLRSNA